MFESWAVGAGFRAAASRLRLSSLLAQLPNRPTRITAAIVPFLPCWAEATHASDLSPRETQTPRLFYGRQGTESNELETKIIGSPKFLAQGAQNEAPFAGLVQNWQAAAKRLQYLLCGRTIFSKTRAQRAGKFF